MSKNPLQSANPKGIDLPILQVGKNRPPASPPKKGRGRYRALVLILIHIIILVHIAHFWRTGRTISPVEPSDSIYTIERGHVNAGAIFFGLAILSTAIFGRFFCGWGCHIVALQDLSSTLLRRIGVRAKPLRSRLLAWIPFILAFYVFFWPTLRRLWMGVPHPGFTNHLVTDNFWYYFPGPIVSILTFFVCGGLIVYLLGNKGFCTYGCPYGAFFSVADRVAPGRIRVTDACLQCGQCTAHCTSNVQVHAEVRDFGMVVDPGCMKCMDCVSVCPHDALYFGLTERPGSRAEQPAEISALPLKAPRSNKSYDFTFLEEFAALLIAGLTAYALRGLYDIFPVLLAVGLAAITAFFAIQFFRFFKSRDQRLQNITLKRSRQITKSGWVTVSVMVVWFGFVIHSWFIQYYRADGRANLARIAGTWDELIFGTAQSRLTAEDHANLERALRSYQRADSWGLANVAEVKLGLAFGNLMKGDNPSAEKYLRQAYHTDPEKNRELLQEFLVSQNRADEAASVR